MTIAEILTELGFTLTDNGADYRALPIYRESHNKTSLSINKITGKWIDYSMGISGTFPELIKLAKNSVSSKEIQDWLNEKGFEPSKDARPKIKMVRTYSNEVLKDLEPIHDYWIRRGISHETMSVFKGGVCRSGKMYGRYVFPIFTSKQEIIGLAGRDVLPPVKNSEFPRPKWKLSNDKMEWKYPLLFNYRDIQEKKEIILVESIGDMLALWDVGITNTLVLFGVMLGAPRLSLILKIDPKRIIIGLNNDADKLINAGQNAANKMQEILSRHFNKEQILIAPPQENDFGVMGAYERTEWYRSIKENKAFCEQS